MAPLHSLGLDQLSPWALALFAYVLIATVWSYLKHPETELPWWKGIPLDTLEALLIVGCMGLLTYAFHTVLGGNYKIGGLQIHVLLDYGHLAVLFRWMLKCLLRMLPRRA